MKFVSLLFLLVSLNSFASDTYDVSFDFTTRRLDLATEEWIQPKDVVKKTFQITLDKGEEGNLFGMSSIEQTIYGIKYSFDVILQEKIDPATNKKTARLNVSITSDDLPEYDSDQAAVTLNSFEAFKEVDFTIMPGSHQVEGISYFNVFENVEIKKVKAVYS